VESKLRRKESLAENKGSSKIVTSCLLKKFKNSNTFVDLMQGKIVREFETCTVLPVLKRKAVAFATTGNECRR